jgi:hypothetical protein
MKHEHTRNVALVFAALAIAVSAGDRAAAQRAASRQIESAAGSWRTWSIASGSAVSVAAPPDAAATRAEIDALKHQLARDGNSLDNVAYWDRGWPGYRWQEIALAELQADPGANTPRSMALVSIAIHDATVATWRAKYQHARSRPSDVDPTIVPAVAVPRSPSYPSEHAAVAAATADVLAYLGRPRRARRAGGPVPGCRRRPVSERYAGRAGTRAPDWRRGACTRQGGSIGHALGRQDRHGTRSLGRHESNSADAKHLGSLGAHVRRSVPPAATPAAAFPSVDGRTRRDQELSADTDEPADIVSMGVRAGAARVDRDDQLEDF